MNPIIKTAAEYSQTYKASIEDPEGFWETVAKDFHWQKKWDSVLNGNFSEANIKWFEGAQLNITENCLDRHLAENGNKTAFIFEPNNPNEKPEYITYKQLHERVCRLANVLKNKGIKKGDRVCIYLPMVPELAVSLLACARIGAVHSVVFAGFSATALAARINDSDCKLVICADGSFRGKKTLDLKSIIDTALENCKSVETVLVVQRTFSEIKLKPGRDFWLQPLLAAAETNCPAEAMDANDPLYILYTSGSTGKPKGMVHSIAGYMVFTAYTFKNVFQYEEKDVFWCTADIGWVTGHSYLVYGPLLNAATTVLFEGVPNFPDHGRFWEVIEKHKVTQFYTAPTAIRALAKESLGFVEKHDLSSLKILGSVGEPINDEAWQWYHDHIGKGKCPIVDTWWQTETGGIMISPLPHITPGPPAFATSPLPGIQPAIMGENGKELFGNNVEGKLCIKFPWPGMAATIWGDHRRFKETYFSTFENKYFSGDGALRNEAGQYRITGRVDDVIIVSGHNLGSAPIEDAINEHPAVAESAIVGFPHPIKGSALYGFVILKDDLQKHGRELLKTEINQFISNQIGPIAKLDKIQFCTDLPKTRSAKIMRRILRKIAAGESENMGDTSTLVNPEVVGKILKGRV